MNQDYHLIVVGTDISGLVTAYLCAKNGLKVLILDKGELAGTVSNCGTYVISKKILQKIDKQILNELHHDHILNTKMLISAGVADNVELRRTHNFDEADENVLYIFDKAKLIENLIQLAEKAGAEIQSNVLVKKTLVKDDAIKGVEIHTGFKYTALLTMMNDAQQLNFLRELNIENELDVRKNVIFASESLKITKDQIKETFGLGDTDRAAITVVGASEMRGLFTIFTQDNHLQLNILIIPFEGDEQISEIDAMQALNDLKNQDRFVSILKSSEISDRSIAILQIADDFSSQNLFGDGYLVAGMPGKLFTIMNMENANPQIYAGLAAYETVHACNENDRADKKFSGLYYNRLKEYEVFKAIQHSNKMFKYLQNNPQFLGEYPKAIAKYSRELFSDCEDSDENASAFENLTNAAGGFFNLLKDFFGFRRKL